MRTFLIFFLSFAVAVYKFKKPDFKIIRPTYPLITYKTSTVNLTGKMHKTIHSTTNDQTQFQVGHKFKSQKNDNINDFIHKLIGFYKIVVYSKKKDDILMILSDYPEHLNVQQDPLIFWITQESELEHVKTKCQQLNLKFTIEKIN